MTDKITRLISITGLAGLLAAAAALLPLEKAVAQSGNGISISGKWRDGSVLTKPDLTGFSVLRFATDNDYPPFNYADVTGNLAGFNVDLARALCAELSLRCAIRYVAWKQQVQALNEGEVDAVIASRAITNFSMRRVSFSQRYYRTPARFVVLQDTALKHISPGGLEGKRIAVRKGTAHEAYLKAFFPKSEIQSFESVARAREILRSGLADALFGDAIGLMFWLNGTSSEGCCRFAGGPYLEPKYFGDGVGIAVKKDNKRLQRILNYGLDRLRETGVYRNLLLRYFPAGNF